MSEKELENKADGASGTSPVQAGDDFVPPPVEVLQQFRRLVAAKAKLEAERDQIEAARDLGAPWWHIHLFIVMPYAKPGIASGCTMVFMLSAGSLAAPQAGLMAALSQGIVGGEMAWPLVVVGIAMGISGVVGFGMIAGFTPALNLLANVPISVVTDYNLSVIPMFILMGALCSTAGMSTELFASGIDQSLVGDGHRDARPATDGIGRGGRGGRRRRRRRRTARSCTARPGARCASG